MSCEAFLGSRASATSTLKSVSASLSGYVCRGFAYGTPYRFTRTLPIVRSPSFLHPSSGIGPPSGTGILTRCPSTTLFSLALGPDLPSADEPSGGNLGFSGYRILTYIFVTQADILTSASSSSPCRATFSLRQNAPLPLGPRRVASPQLRHQA